MSWGQYKGRSIGRVIQFIYRYSNVHIAEHVQIGDGEVTLHGKPFATYVWEEGDVPHFTFAPEYAFLQKVQDYKKAEVVERESMSPMEYVNLMTQRAVVEYESRDKGKSHVHSTREQRQRALGGTE